MSKADTSTTLNTGSGGSVMDEAQVSQADGSTTVHRTRVQLGYEADDDRDRLVSQAFPLPTADDRALALLQQMADDLREMKQFLFGVFTE